MLIVLFGLSGAGKSYIGQLLAQHTNLYFWDADEALTEDMHNCLLNNRSFTQAMRDHFVDIVIENIKKLQKTYPHLVVAQALYKNKNRKQILNTFLDTHFVEIEVNNDIIEQRLRQRVNSINPDYAHLIRRHFESPTHPHWVINNNNKQNDAHLIVQFQAIIPLAKRLEWRVLVPSELSSESKST